MDLLSGEELHEDLQYIYDPFPRAQDVARAARISLAYSKVTHRLCVDDPAQIVAQPTLHSTTNFRIGENQQAISMSLNGW